MFNSGFHLDPVDEVPMGEQERAADISLELQQGDAKEARSLTKTAQDLTGKYEKELRAIIGEGNLERYIEFRSPLRQRIREAIPKAKPTAAGEGEIREVRRKVAAESQRYLKRIGFDMARASKVRGDYHTRLHEALTKARGKPEEPNYALLPDEVPKDVHNPWVIYHAPYPGSVYSVSWGKSDEPYYPIYVGYLDSLTGQLGSYSHIHVSGADDSDYSYVRYRTAMRFWYRMPATGMAEIYMMLRCVWTPYSGDFDDEWGWSDANCDQEHYAYLRVISPAVGANRYSTLLDYRRTGTDAKWSRIVANPNDVRWPHIFSADPYVANTWLLLEVGTEEWNHFWSNDVSLYSNMTMRWLLERVYVKSTGE